MNWNTSFLVQQGFLKISLIYCSYLADLASDFWVGRNFPHSWDHSAVSSGVSDTLWQDPNDLPRLLFPPVNKVLVVVRPARLEASPPQPAPIGLSTWTSSPLRRGRRLRIFCLLFSGRFQDFSIVGRWLTGHCPPIGFPAPSCTCGLLCLHFACSYLRRVTL